jgi:hypothetical protein
MGFGLFRKQPISKQVRAFFAQTIHATGAKPKYVICDRGPQFCCKTFERW